MSSANELLTQPYERGDRPPSVPSPVLQRVLVAAAVLTAIAATYVMRIADADLWGHLRYGRFFLESDSLALSDPFACISAGLSRHT